MLLVDVSLEIKSAIRRLRFVIREARLRNIELVVETTRPGPYLPKVATSVVPWLALNEEVVPLAVFA